MRAKTIGSLALVLVLLGCSVVQGQQPLPEVGTLDGARIPPLPGNDPMPPPSMPRYLGTPAPMPSAVPAPAVMPAAPVFSTPGPNPMAAMPSAVPAPSNTLGMAGFASPGPNPMVTTVTNPGTLVTP